MFRFTIRDLLRLTMVVVAVSLVTAVGGTACYYGSVALCDYAWDAADKAIDKWPLGNRWAK